MTRNRKELLKKYLEQGGPIAEHLRKQRSLVEESDNPSYIEDLYELISKSGNKLKESDGQFTGGWYVERWESGGEYSDYYFDFTFCEGEIMEMQSYEKSLYNSNEV